MTYEFEAIGHIHSPYREKFAIPRQPGLASAAQSHIELTTNCNHEAIVRGLEQFSHIWIVFVFHQSLREQWKPMVRPPRLGGNKKVGVFASRSPFRPNPVGLSAVKLEDIRQQTGKWQIHFSGGDLLHGTPVVDIKPYIPYSDSIAEAHGAWAEHPPELQTVVFSPKAQQQLSTLLPNYPKLDELITQVLSQQPQPAYQQQTEREYGMSLYDINIRWRSVNAGPDQQQVVLSLER